jgi:SAM-dependent methyltransferase
MRFENKPMEHDKIDPSSLDYSMFGPTDYLNFTLQRSEILFDINKAGRLIKSWSNGQGNELDVVVAEKGSLLGERTVQCISNEFDELRTTLDPISPKTIADIGCGYAIFDLLAAKTYNSKIHLIDVETNGFRHFGFTNQASAYSNLTTAKEFLTKNGISPADITLTNPEKADIMQSEPVDLAVSFLACGFHFPIDSYMPYFKEKIKHGGHIIIDIRKRTYSKQGLLLCILGSLTVLREAQSYVRVLVTKHA